MAESVLINEIQRQAVSECLRMNLPFALTLGPGERSARFFASEPDEDGRNEALLDNSDWSGFFINFFGNDEPYPAGVADKMNEAAAIEFCHSLSGCLPAAELSLQTTEQPRLLYLASVASIALGLKVHGGKTVFSRMIFKSGERRILDVAEDYFRMLPDTFRYVCFTQETGLWFGATPELLFDYHSVTSSFSTMALAGTRPVSLDSPWDIKNVEEHSLVVSFIKDCIEGLGGTVSIHPRRSLPFGDIEHLLTPIDGSLPVNSLYKALCSLSPTPAVAGFPRSRAIGEIFTSEIHSRYCYAGFVGVKQRERLSAYVNLRCAMAAPKASGCGYDYNLFVGGGITGRSNPDKEWAETEAKASILSSVINPKEAKIEIDE